MKHEGQNEDRGGANFKVPSRFRLISEIPLNTVRITTAVVRSVYTSIALSKEERILHQPTKRILKNMDVREKGKSSS